MKYLQSEEPLLTAVDRMISPHTPVSTLKAIAAKHIANSMTDDVVGVCVDRILPEIDDTDRRIAKQTRDDLLYERINEIAAEVTRKARKYIRYMTDDEMDDAVRAVESALMEKIPFEPVIETKGGLWLCCYKCLTPFNADKHQGDIHSDSTMPCPTCGKTIEPDNCTEIRVCQACEQEIGEEWEHHMGRCWKEQEEHNGDDVG